MKFTEYRIDASKGKESALWLISSNKPITKKVVLKDMQRAFNKSFKGWEIDIAPMETKEQQEQLERDLIFL